MGIRTLSIFVSMGLTMCLSSARHKYLKVSYDSIAALDGSEGTTISSRQWTAQLEKVAVSIG